MAKQQAAIVVQGSKKAYKTVPVQQVLILPYKGSFLRCSAPMGPADNHD